jgi:hypothetical protein
MATEKQKKWAEEAEQRRARVIAGLKRRFPTRDWDQPAIARLTVISLSRVGYDLTPGIGLKWWISLPPAHPG